MLEEVCGLVDQRLRQVVVGRDLVVVRRQLVVWHGEDLLVGALVIRHHQDADRTRPHNTARN